MEAEFIQWVRGRVTPSNLLPVGIGDDAAVLSLAATDVVVTSDMLMDGVDFELDRCDPRRAGRKALAVNLSDLAAMAARPLAAIVSLALPRQHAAQLARSLYEGLLPLADEFEVVLAGGDTNSWDGPCVISVTALGTQTGSGPLLRSTARPGDEILVTGSFGGSILGKHFDFRPRVHEALELCEHYELHAGIDVSDGLSLDLSRVAVESGCGAVIDPLRVPISAAAHELSLRDGWSPLDHALGDGEDFELILAVPPDVARRLLDVQPLDVAITSIGHFTKQPGLWRTTTAGGKEWLEPSGYEHL